MEDRTNRTANGRFVRNLVLSLAGGAALTLIGATAAHADEAGTASDGAGTTGTGDATAVGNKSGTQTGQTLAPSGGGGTPQIITQTAVVPNVGVAVANTGGNVAIGNASDNTAGATQTATGGGIANANNGDASNASNGSAWITTGDASAIGNESDTTITQGSHGALDGLLVVDQDALVVNAGLAVANSGINAAVGNASTNTAGLLQSASTNSGLATNTGTAATGSNGRGAISTGDAAAVGNTSRTEVAQGGGPGDGATGGLVIIDQNALVANAGLGIANSGGNIAVGNVAQITSATAAQQAIVNPDTPADDALASNSADVSTDSDGTATISTGDAAATGNDSNTNVTQAAYGEPSAMGGAVTAQNAGVLNVGVGAANTGLNAAIGNVSETAAGVGDLGQPQRARVVNDVEADRIIASNSANVSAASDGTAEIATGDASATGNDSDTTLDQQAASAVPGAGLAVSTQTAGVLNAGAAVANSGVNLAVGNVSTNAAAIGTVAGDPQRAVVNPAAGSTLEAPIVTASNAADASSTSDGSASIDTGDATARGNVSSTDLAQHADNAVDGAGVIVNAQTAGVANLGLGIANSGINAAVGNASVNGAGAAETARINADGLEATGPVTVANTAAATAASDGSASVGTGDGTADGNVSDTTLSQAASNTIGADGAGVVPNVQTAGVLNAGVGLANSGVNGAVGNASGLVGGLPNLALAEQRAIVTDGDIEVDGPVTVTNTVDVSSASDGTAKVRTGDATATGNSSYTTLSQSFDGDVDGMGIVVAPQTAAVVNVGAGVANSGVNAAVGNLSSSTATIDGPAGVQVARFDPAAGTTVDGPVTVGNTATAANSSDGEACTCTGDATASGNISRSNLSQDMEIGVEDGVSVAPATGTIFNAGFGLANSGVNLAIGNISQNDATTTQRADFDSASTDLDAQTIVNNGGASNTSTGTGKVGTGKASAIGNLSESDLAQAAVIDGAGVIAPMTGTIANAGLGLANAGVNLGVGNASTNSATTVQDASGEGLVSNSGSADNESDGTAQIGDPNCDDEVTTPEEDKDEAPGAPTLPRTGNELQVEAALALMLLLAGFGLRKGAKHLA